ncbi:MAG: hypothetical protein ACI4TF_14115 [Oliverpabstia sp.]
MSDNGTTLVESDGTTVKYVGKTDNGMNIIRYILTNQKSSLPSKGANTARLFTLLRVFGVVGYGIYETLRRRKRNK